MELYLDSCQRVGIEVEVIIFPVNGKWNDYTGVSREMREKTYKNRRCHQKAMVQTIKLWKQRVWWLLFIWRDARWVKGWMEVEKNFTNLQTKAN